MSETVSRREFLKIAGIAGATVGVGAGLGGLLAACGGAEETTTTTTAGGATTTTTAGGATTTTVAASTTTVSAGAEVGREIKLGFVTPQTGPLASFGIADKYCVDHFKEIIGDGLVLGDGKKHPITVLLEDSQSNSNRSAQVAGDLILNAKVDMMMAASSGDNMVPVSDQAEANEIPCISSTLPGRRGSWAARAMPRSASSGRIMPSGARKTTSASTSTCGRRCPNNKVVGVLWPNDVDGNNYRSQWPDPMTKAGYTIVDGGSFQDGMEDYTSIIDKFKKGGAEVLSGVMSPPDFTNFWKQTKQQGYTPKITGIGKALLFPQTGDALGAIGEGLCTTCWWHPTYPFTSPLTGETCQQFADNYEKKCGKQWTQPLLHFMIFEWAIDVLKRTNERG